MRVILWTVRILVALVLALVPAMAQAQAQPTSKLSFEFGTMLTTGKLIQMHDYGKQVSPVSPVDKNGSDFSRRPQMNYFVRVHELPWTYTTVSFGRGTANLIGSWYELAGDRTQTDAIGSNVSGTIKRRNKEFEVTQSVRLSSLLTLYGGLSMYSSTFEQVSDEVSGLWYSETDLEHRHLGPILGLHVSKQIKKAVVNGKADLGLMTLTGNYAFRLTDEFGQVLPEFNKSESTNGRQLRMQVTVGYPIHNKFFVEGGIAHHRHSTNHGDFLFDSMSDDFKSLMKRTSLVLNLRIRP